MPRRSASRHRATISSRRSSSIRSASFPSPWAWCPRCIVSIAGAWRSRPERSRPLLSRVYVSPNMPIQCTSRNRMASFEGNRLAGHSRPFETMLAAPFPHTSMTKVRRNGEFSASCRVKQAGFRSSASGTIRATDHSRRGVRFSAFAIFQRMAQRDRRALWI